MSATATAINNNFEKVFKKEFELTMVKAVDSMFDKYYTEAYTANQVQLIEDMILTATMGCKDRRIDLRMMCWKKTSWMSQMKVIRRYIKEAGKRKCNDCNKLWYECRNTCIKPKTNPRPMEFPQDVFNVVKDYLGVYDIPEPITELMGMMKLQNLKDDVMMTTKSRHYVGIKDQKSFGVDGRLSLYKSKVVWDTKNPNYPFSEKNDFLLKIANKYPQLKFGKELTDNNKIFLMDLLFTNNYEGTEDQGLKTEASLFDFMRGECGLGKFKKTPKKPKPYVMYFERDYYGEEYAVKNFAYDMRDFYNSMEKSDLKTIRYACNHLLS